MREVGEVEIETEEVRHVVGTEDIFSKYTSAKSGEGKREICLSEMKKVSLSVSKGRVTLVLFYHKRSLNQNLSYSRCGIMSEMRFRNLFFMQLVHARIISGL